MSQFQLTRGIQQIGNTLFINGSPHHKCGVCGTVVSSDEYQRTLKSQRGKVAHEVKPYKVTILKGWLEGETKHTVVDGYPTADTKWIPLVKQVESCFSCWNTQQNRKAQSMKLADWAFAAK